MSDLIGHVLVLAFVIVPLIVALYLLTRLIGYVYGTNALLLSLPFP